MRAEGRAEHTPPAHPAPGTCARMPILSVRDNHPCRRAPHGARSTKNNSGGPYKGWGPADPDGILALMDGMRGDAIEVPARRLRGSPPYRVRIGLTTQS
jgi:hypothetical protein